MLCFLFLRFILCSATFSGLWTTPNTAFYVGLQAEYTERMFFQIGNRTLEYSLQVQDVVANENISALYSYTLPLTCAQNWCETAWERGFDAAWRWRSRTYFFLGSYYSRPNPEGEFGTPNSITGGWPGVGFPVDAAAEADVATNDWAFVGDDAYLYSVPGDKMIQKADMAAQFPGVPMNLSSATRHYHTGYMLFLKDDQYWAFDPVNLKVLPGFPRNLITDPSTCEPEVDLSSIIGFVSDKSGTGPYLPNSHCSWRVYVPQLYCKGIYGEYQDNSQLESSSSNFMGMEIRFSRFNLSEGDTVQIWANNDIHAPANDPYGTSNQTLLWTFTSDSEPPAEVLLISNASKSFRVQFDTTGDPGKSDGFQLDYWVKNSDIPFRTLLGPVWLTSYKTSTPTTVVVQPATQTTSIIDFRVYLHTLLIPDDPVKRAEVQLKVYDGLTANDSNLVATCTGTSHSPYSCMANIYTDRCPCLATTVSGFATLVLTAPDDILAAANARYTVRSTCNGFQSFTEKTGKISDGSGDLLYFTNQFCVWYINNTFDPDALVVSLTFESFSIQKDIATVSIWESSTNTSAPTQILTGTIVGPYEVIARAPEMLVTFNPVAVTSSAINPLSGFEAVYNVIYAPDKRYTTMTGFESVIAATPNTSRYDIVCDVGTQLSLTVNAKDKFQRTIDPKYSPAWYQLFLRAIPIALEPFNESILNHSGIINASSPTAQEDADAMGISLEQMATILDYPATGNTIPMTLPTKPGGYVVYLIMAVRGKSETQIFPLSTDRNSLRLLLVAAAPVASASSLALCSQPDLPVNESDLSGVAGQEQSFCISVRDRFYNILGRGRSDVRVFVISASYAIPVKSSDYQNGSYLATALPYTAASYSMTVLVGGSDIPGSPFGYFVSPGPTAPNKTTVVVNGVSVIDFGKIKFANLNLVPQTPFNITVKTYDAQQNFRNELGDVINLTISGEDSAYSVTPLQITPIVRSRPSPPSDDIEGVQGASYTFTVVVSNPGDFNLKLKVNNHSILTETGEPATINLVVGFKEELRASWHRILAILAIIFNTLICTASAILVWLRRKRVPLKPLSPALLLLNTFGCLTFIHYALVEIFDESYPCLLYFRGSLVPPILWMNPLLLSIYRLRLVFPYSALKRKWAKISLDANALANIQTKRMSFSENRFLLYYFITTVPPVAIILILGAVIGKESGVGCTMDTSLEAIWGTLGAIYFILFLVAIISVRDFDERLGFRQEIALCGMYASAIALVTIVIRFSQSGVSPGTKDDLMLLVSLIPLAFQVRGVLLPALRTIALFMNTPNSEIELPLTEVLVTKNGFEFFCGFCCMEFSQENPLCWDAIENFRKKTSVAALRDIYHKFFLPDSPLQVNFPANVIRELQDIISKTDESTQIALIQGAFDNAQNEVISLMTNDSYRRFLASDAYKAFRAGEKPPSRDAFTTRSDTHPESTALSDTEQVELTRLPERKRISAVGLFDTTETEPSRPESKTGTFPERPRDESRMDDDDQPTKIISDLPPLISELSQDQEAYVI